MRLWFRCGPALLLLGAALAGCDGGPGSTGPAALNPNLPRVTLEVPGMT